MALGHYMREKSAKSKGSSPAESTYQTDAKWRRTAMWREGLRAKVERYNASICKDEGSASLVEVVGRWRFGKAGLTLPGESWQFDSRLELEQAGKSSSSVLYGVCSRIGDRVARGFPILPSPSHIFDIFIFLRYGNFFIFTLIFSIFNFIF